MTEAEVKALFEYVDAAIKVARADHLIDHHGGLGKWLGLPPVNTKEKAQEKLIEVLCREHGEVRAQSSTRNDVEAELPSKQRAMRTPDDIVGEALTRLDFDQAPSRSMQFSVVLVLEVLLDIRELITARARTSGEAYEKADLKNSRDL